jgi:signal transduction histidine kinase
MVALTVVMVGLTGLACGTWAASRAWNERIERGRQIVETLERSNYPLTDAVLEQLRGLGGAEFALVDERGLVRKATQPALLGARFVVGQEPGDPSFRRFWRPPAEGGSAFRVASVTRRGSVSQSAAHLLVLLPEPALQAAAWEAGRTILGLTLLGAGLAALVALAVGRALAAPLVQIARALQRIGRGESIGALPRERPDEIGELADAVSRLGGRLETLERERTEAERLHLVRQLAAGLAHEIRNPLTAARMTLQLLERRHVQEQPLGEPLRMALGELGRMERQVKRFLQIARPDPPRFAPVCAQALIAEAVNRVAAAYELRGRRLEVREGPESPTLRADPDQIGQVLVNLLQNALDASPASIAVRIGAGTIAGRGVIRVDDEGPGVPESVVGQLFQPFVTTKPEGVGLGLALCASLVREHDGRLTYAREGGVSVFRVDLPLAASEPGRPEPNRSADPLPHPHVPTGALAAWPT